MRKILFIIVLLIATAAANAQVKVEARLDSISILVGSQTSLTVTVKNARAYSTIDFPSFQNETPMAPGLEVVRTMDDSIGADVRRTYVITAWDEGRFFVPQMKVKVNGKEYDTKTIPLEVKTIKVDTAQTDSIRPMKGVAGNPYSWDEWSTLFWLSVVALLLLAVAYYLYVRLRDNKPVITRIRFIKKLLPHEKALKKIEEIKSEHLAESDDQKAYYTELTDVLRQYLDDRFGIKAKEMTSSEILYRLQKEDDQSKIDELRHVFETADLVKFAKYSVENNINDAYLTSVVDFIDSTKQENAPTVEKTGSKLSASDKKKMRTRTGLRAMIAVVVIAVVAIFAYIVWRAATMLW